MNSLTNFITETKSKGQIATAIQCLIDDGFYEGIDFTVNGQYIQPVGDLSPEDFCDSIGDRCNLVIQGDSVKVI